jgi:hypothetical protein
MAPQFGVFSPSDLELLQSVYDEATDGLTSVDDTTMVEIAHALFDAHAAGVRDRDHLLGMATSALYRRTA